MGKTDERAGWRERVRTMAGEHGKAKRRAVAYVVGGRDREVVRDAAKRERLRIVGWHQDDRGTSAAERTGLADALAAVADGNSDGVIVASLATFGSRAEAEAVLLHFWLKGARVVTADAGEIQRDEDAGPLRRVATLAVDLNDSLSKARRRSGRQRKRESGAYAGGRPPYGWRLEDGELVEDIVEQATIRRMVQLAETDQSLAKIVDVLTQEGRRPRNAERWSRQSVHKVLQRVRSKDAETEASAEK